VVTTDLYRTARPGIALPAAHAAHGEPFFVSPCEYTALSASRVEAERLQAVFATYPITFTDVSAPANPGPPV
jgi:hypothetical protein